MTDVGPDAAAPIEALEGLKAAEGLGDADVAARLALGRAREMARLRGLMREPRRKRDALRAADAARDAAAGRGSADVDGTTGAGTTPARRPWRPGPGLGDVLTGPSPSPRDPQPLSGLAARVIAQQGWLRGVSVGGVVGRWREVVGDQIADHCQVETFEDGALVLRAGSTAWATQVRLLLPQLERRIAEEVGEGTVTSITVLGPGGPSWKHGKRTVRGRGPRDTYG